MTALPAYKNTTSAFHPTIDPNALRNDPVHATALLVGNMVEQCRIQPGCLEASLTRSASLCTQNSLKTIQDFCQAQEVLRTYKVLNARRMP